jgi:type I restriction enzyme, S subunit
MKPGYKQTEVGVIPEEWETKRLREVATIATGNTPPTSDASNYGDDFLFVGPVDMGDAKFIAKTEKMLSKKGFAMSRRFPKDSILFVSIGSTIGKCGIAPVELTSNQQINAIFPSISFSADYLFYAVSSAAPRIKAQAGEQAVPIVNKTQFSETVVPLPPLPEQRAIAAALSDVDALLGGLERLITKKRDLKQAAMQQLLTGQTRLPGFDGAWEVKRLGEVLKIKHGKNQTNVMCNNSEIPIYGSGGIIGYATEYLWNKPSILIGRKGTIDVPYFIDTPFWTVDTMFYSEIYPNTDTKYLYYVFNTINWYSYNEASGVPSLNAKTIEKIYIPIPPLPEQIAIAAVLSDMDAELVALEQRRTKTRALKQAMMQELLTGRTRLIARGDAENAE